MICQLSKTYNLEVLKSPITNLMAKLKKNVLNLAKLKHNGFNMTKQLVQLRLKIYFDNLRRRAEFNFKYLRLLCQ